MPNDVAQKRKTTLAAETIPGMSAGSVTVRSTCTGEAPSAAAACSRRGSSPSHIEPTVRTTTARLKNTIAATIAAGVPSRRSGPSGPDGASNVRNATPTTTVGITNGTSRNARSTPLPGNRSRCRTKAAGNPSRTVTKVASPADHTVNQSTRRTWARPSTSRTAPGSNEPSEKKPRLIIPATGSTKKTPSTSNGNAARATTCAPARPLVPVVIRW
jgi:hypothetical protein